MEVENSGEIIQPKGWALVFHPDLIHGTSLGQHIKDYTFFSYEVYEGASPVGTGTTNCA